MRRRKKRPKYCGPHDPSGLAYVWVGKRQHYFTGAPWNTPESWRQYEEWCQANCDPQAASAPSIPKLLMLYLEHAESRYGHTKEWKHLNRIGQQLAEEYPTLKAKDFGPLKLQEFRRRLIGSDYARSYINDQIHRIRRIFRWAVSQELIRPEVLLALETVPGLRAGQGKEPKDVLPANPVHVAKAKQAASPPIAAALTLLECTGMRAANVCSIRWLEIDRTSDVWLYSPYQHKSKHRGRLLTVPLGPKVQEALLSLPGKTPEEWLLSPRDAAIWHSEQRGTKRPSVSPRINPYYRPRSLSQAIEYACDKAGVPHFHPHQLRHSISAAVKAKYGIEEARAFLGHANVNITELYAKRDLDTAIEIARRLG